MSWISYIDKKNGCYDGNFLKILKYKKMWKFHLKLIIKSIFISIISFIFDSKKLVWIKPIPLGQHQNAKAGGTRTTTGNFILKKSYLKGVD